MKNRSVVILIGLILGAVFLPAVRAGDTGVVVDQQLVTITLTDKGLLVSEDIKVTNSALENTTLLRFWLQQNAQDITITAGASNTNLIPFTVTSGYVRTCNLSTANLTILPATSLSVHLTYDLSSSAETFEQTLLYDTTLCTVSYNGQTLYQGEHLVARTDGTTLQIRLFKPTEAPLSMTVIIVIFVIVVAVLGILLFILQRQRSKAKKGTLGESEETLATKKTLLLSLLKDLEKQYRAKSISDETYTKLKDEYKQQAVDAMKRLDDMKK